jgi:MazG family protein
MNPERLSRAVAALVDLLAKLRGPGGCPWDAKQTDSTIRLYLLEEAYEVLDAIERAAPQDVCQELGDLLFHILFLARLAEERKEFDFTGVVERITEKMIRRHPHVFGQKTVDSAEEVVDNWARIKKEEKKVSGDTSSPLNDIPVNLPSLLRAHRLTERASKVFNDSPDPGDVWDSVVERFEGLKAAVVGQDRDLFGREMGAYFFCLVNLTRLWRFNSEDLLRTANKEFKDRCEKVEGELDASGIRPEGAASEKKGKGVLLKK